MKWLWLAAAMSLAGPAQAQIVIAHRGASGERPEHTLGSYERGIDQGADYIEPDLVPTKDGVLVARHENEISGTTDVAGHPEFAARRTTRVIDGQAVTGWFTEDFTLAELRTLRARERLPQLRPANTRFDGLWQVPTFAEVVALLRAKQAETGRRIGIYPELKHPVYFAARGIDTPALLLAALKAAKLDGEGEPVFIQSFEVGALERLRPLTKHKLVLLVAREGGPVDKPGVSYASLLEPAGLKQVTRYADAIGAEIPLLVDAAGKPTPLVAAAHDAGLEVHAWTLRRENAFLPPALRAGSEPGTVGNIRAAWQQLRDAGVDGVFTDNPGDVAGGR